MAVFPVLERRNASLAVRNYHDGQRVAPGGSLVVPGRSSNQNGATSNLAILDHLQNDGGGLARLFLADKALRGGTWLESRGIDAEAANVGVSSDEVETAQVLALGNGYERLEGGFATSISIKSRRNRLGWRHFMPFATYSSHRVVFGARKPAEMFVCWGADVKSCERSPVLALPFEKGNGSPRSFPVAGVWLV